MNILIISQVFWPSTASTAQHLTDLAENLIIEGYKVEVLTSSRDYESTKTRYYKKEKYNGINITRIWNTGFGKTSKIGRLLDFITFNIALFLRLVTIKKRKYSLIIGMTSPPLISFLGVIAAHLKKAKFLYWVMDLQPELSIATGYIKNGSIASNVLLRLGDYIFKRADSVIALDRYMKDYIVNRGGDYARISVIPVWPVMKEIYTGERSENPFRKENNFGDKIVVMYSGNHSVVHPLDTLLEAILNLRYDNRFLFVFIGGGVRKKDVSDFKAKHNLNNILQMGYQERERIHLSLSSADIHVVVQGNDCIGFTHPNKIYGAMFIGRPILYIGPDPSHISDILKKSPKNLSVSHGEGEKLEKELLNFADMDEEYRIKVGIDNRSYVKDRFTRELLAGEMIEVIEKLCIGAHNE
jgi:glycosyltransferase involved in cell wall biosynthesis